ncbi:hypothetical protein N9W89_01020 [Hellea sp.]|nr:hypothetical protein [Hellea sp.]
MTIEKISPKTVSTDSSPEEWRLVLKLVGLMAVANGRLTPEDMKAYQDQMMELRAVIDPTLVMTRRMIRDWFIYHKDELTDIIDGLQIDSELLTIFKEVRNFRHKFDVITAMVQVGIADGDYGRMEKVLIKKTILYWNIRNTEDDSDLQPYLTQHSVSAA